MEFFTFSWHERLSAGVFGSRSGAYEGGVRFSLQVIQEVLARGRGSCATGIPLVVYHYARAKQIQGWRCTWVEHA